MKISVVIPSLTGLVPDSVPADPRLEVIVVKGVSPVGKARNEGLRGATGDYIAWVDSDDEIAAEWLDEIFNALESNAMPDVVVIDMEYVGWKDGRKECVWGVRRHEATMERLLRDVYRDICRPSTLFLYIAKRELWSGLHFDENVRIAEDYLILPHVLVRAKSCAYIPLKLYRYKSNPLSLVNTHDFGKELEVMDIREMRLEETPPEYRGACLFGLAISCYWNCDRVAMDAGLRSNGDAMACAKRSRSFIKGNMRVLLGEVFAQKDLKMRVRMGWCARFICAAIDWWWPQKLRHAWRGSVR